MTTTLSPRCTECDAEIAAFEVDGTSKRLGYRCLRSYVDAATGLTLGELLRRLGEKDK
jgi:hypothetical protein